MVLESYRERVRPYVERLSNPFLSWTPNRLSVVALSLAGLAGALAASARWLGPLVFLPVAAAIFLSGVFDVIDGDVARRTHRTSVRGDFVDHVFDRYADVFIVVGIAISSYANAVLALFALVSLLLTSYMGTQAQAVGAGRAYAGLLSRADRLIILALATFIEFLLALTWPGEGHTSYAQFTWMGLTFTVLDIALLYFVIAGQWTAIARARATYRALPPPPSGDRPD
jgi:archaetidylinositol phosphate synthase